MKYLSFIGLFFFFFQFSWGQAIVEKEALEPQDLSYIVGSVENNKEVGIRELAVYRTGSIFGEQEFLEIIFDVYNHTVLPKKLRVAVVGFYFTNFFESEYRKNIPYPSWRKRDFDTEIKYIAYLDSIPKKDLFEFVQQNQLAKFTKQRRFNPSELNNIKFGKYLVPIDYLQYLQSAIPKVGIPFTLSSRFDKSSYNEIDTAFIIDRCRFIKSLLETNINCKIESKKTFNIREKKFFTHFAVVLYDEDKKEIIYRKLFKFTREPLLN